MPRISAAERRSDFVRAAVDVIAARGVDGATTRRIAEQAQAPLATLHYCYDSKEDLLTDVFEFVAGRFRDVIVSSEPRADLVLTAQALLRDVMEFYLESPNLGSTALEVTNWARRQNRDHAITVYDKAMETLRDTLRSAAADRSIEPETIDHLAYVIASLADGFGLNWLTYGDRSTAAEQMEISASVLESWLATRLEPAPAAR
ncbi:TetR/AcrR family transcriptional regulator [Saccharopolyspora sp. TS4A08]|uniref:TetR/AcrR family transcriptional regulator n=1 Tax=Saccharopolyspora ipomoeae TaxID=3042027 RepID=A0ABT6PRK9_9PSEU|nr:TetR/AcrR family transcriptional regulator [Saccharopolyspora sp. TS4A08]MDI2030594.1 TetR/AcrR family transcriptional regulator [Saccharopolyspora sp. TS4A08]